MDVTISAPGAKSKSPLQGYEVRGNKLIYVEQTMGLRGSRLPDYESGNHGRKPIKHHFDWAAFCYGVIATILFMFILWGGDKLYESIFNSEEQVNQASVVPTTTSVPSDTTENTSIVKTTVEQAISYLDNSYGAWERDSLINYPELASLFEELNTYQFDEILKRESLLSGSRNFKDVVDAIRINRRKKFEGNFCPENDFKITVSKYIDKLNRTEETPKTTEESVATKAEQKVYKKSQSIPEQDASKKSKMKDRGSV